MYKNQFAMTFVDMHYFKVISISTLTPQKSGRHYPFKNPCLVRPCQAERWKVLSFYVGDIHLISDTDKNQ